jgi:hypothetical protein
MLECLPKRGPLSNDCPKIYMSICNVGWRRERELENVIRRKRMREGM